MAKFIEIPNVGRIGFPDSMDDKQIVDAIEKDILPNHIVASSKQSLPSQNVKSNYVYPTPSNEDPILQSQYTPGIDFPNAREQGIGVARGVLDAGEGIKQLLLEAGEKLGIAQQGSAQNYTQQIDKERANYGQTQFAQDPNAQVGRFIGSNVPYFAIPMGSTGNLASRMGKGLLGGSVIGGAQYVPEGESRGKNTLIGGGVGAAFPVAEKVAAKGYNFIRGNVDDAAQKLIDLGKKHNVPLFAADASNSSLLKGVDQALESIPWLGNKAQRRNQMVKAQSAAERESEKLQQEMINIKPDITEIKKVAKNPNSKRYKEANNLLSSIDNAGDDWNKIIETSGKTSLLNKKLVADKKYDALTREADKLGNINSSNIANKTEKILSDEMRSVIKDESLIKYLNNIKDGLYKDAPTGPGKKILRDLTFSDLRNMRSKLGSTINDYYSGKNALIGDNGVASLEVLKNTVENTLNKFAQNNGKQLKTLWKDADTYYKNVVTPYKDKQLAQALQNGLPDEIYSKFISTGTKREGGKGTSRAQKFYNALDEKGQAAVRYGMVSNALEKAINRDTQKFSPAIFASELDTIAAGKGVFFKGQAKAEIDGFKNLMRHVERSKIAIDKPETGVKSIPWLAGIAVGGAKAYGVSWGKLGLTTASIYGLKKIMTTDTGRRFLLASSKYKAGSPEMEKAVEKLSAGLQREAEIESTRTKKKKNN